LFALAVMLAAGSARAQVDADLEPNDTPGDAAPIAISPGQWFTGTTTGTQSGPAVGGTSASADFIRVTITGLPIGTIRRNRLILTTTGSSGHTMAIMGQLAQNTPPTPPTILDEWFISQLSSINTTPARMVQFYTMGNTSVDVLLRITGTQSTSGPYRVTLSSEDVNPAPAQSPSGLYAGNITLTTNNAGHTTDTTMVLYDSNFVPIAWSFDNPLPASTINATLAPGNYLVAVTQAGTTTNLLPQAGDLVSNILLAPNATGPGGNILISASSASTPVNLTFTLRGASYTGDPLEPDRLINIPLSRPGSYGVAFQRLFLRCPGDIAGANQSRSADGQKTPDDIIVYLGDYFQHAGLAQGLPRGRSSDIAGPNQSTSPDGVTDANDLIRFINAYFTDCN
jgi:hypothetical protein